MKTIEIELALCECLRMGCLCELIQCGGARSPVVFQQVWQLWCQQVRLWTDINRDWCSARFVSCLTVVNQCTVKAWIFLMPVQNAAKKKGIPLPLTTHATLLLSVSPSCKETSMAGERCSSAFCGKNAWFKWLMQHVMPSQVYFNEL